jgi:hypothetical protein
MLKRSPLFFVAKAASLTLLSLICTAAHATRAIAIDPHGGFWYQTNRNGATQGGTIARNGARQFDAGGPGGAIVAPSSPTLEGYWVVYNDGAIVARGDVRQLCSNLKLCSVYKKGFIASASAKSDGSGFWVIDNAGHVYTVGSAKAFGDASKAAKGSIKAVQIEATPTGSGYYIFMSDGGVYTFGDAVYFGSGYKKIEHTLGDAALSYDALGRVNGYWIVDTGNKLYYFGAAAHFDGDMCTDGPQSSSLASYQDRAGFVTAEPDGSFKECVYPRTKLVSFGSQMAITTAAAGEPITQQLTGNAADDQSQLWDMFPISGNPQIVGLRSVATGLCVSASSDNENVLSETCDLSEEQKWSLKSLTLHSWMFTPLNSASSSLYSSGSDVGSNLKTLRSGSLDTKFATWNASLIPSKGILSLATGYASVTGDGGCSVASKSTDKQTDSTNIVGKGSAFEVRILGHACTLHFTSVGSQGTISISLVYRPEASGISTSCAGCKQDYAQPAVFVDSGIAKINMPPAATIVP